jgi:hypothetical protein
MDDQIEMLEQIIADKEVVIQGLHKTIEQMRADGINQIESEINKAVSLEAACDSRTDNMELKL